MTFTVNDLQDLLRLLDEHPDWREALRRRILTDELLALPELVRGLVEAQARTEERLQRIEAAIERLQGAIDRLVEAQGRTDTRLGRLEGWALESRYREHATAYFGRMIRRGRVLDNARVADLLDDAVDDGRITWNERADALWADVVMAGRRPDDGSEIYLVAEVSVGIEPEEVERAADRAAILERLGRPVLPVVAGEQISGPAVALARERGVQQILDGAILT